MKPSEIEALRAQHALVVEADAQAPCPHGERQGYCDRCEYEHSILYDLALHALPRLLEERKMLFEALRAASQGCGVMCFGDRHCPHTEGREAIRKAES